MKNIWWVLMWLGGVIIFAIIQSVHYALAGGVFSVILMMYLQMKKDSMEIQKVLGELKEKFKI